MITPKIFKSGNSQAIRIPAELAYGAWDTEFAIERIGGGLRIRPVPRRIGDAFFKLARFSPDVMVSGSDANGQADRDTL